MKKLGRPALDKSPAREKIINIASNVFRDLGYDKTTVELICNRAEVGKTSYYRHFEDKADLAILVVERFLSDELSRARSLINKPMDFSEKLDFLMLEIEKNRKKLGMLFLEEFFLIDDPRVLKLSKKSMKTFKEVNKELLKQGQKAKVFSDELTLGILEFLLRKRQQLAADKDLKYLIPDSDKRFKFVNNLLFKGVKAA